MGTATYNVIPKHHKELLQRIGLGQNTRTEKAKRKKSYSTKEHEDAFRWGRIQEQAVLGDVEPQRLFVWGYGLEENLFLDGHPELCREITSYAVDLVRDMELDSANTKYTSSVEDRATYKDQAANIRKRADEIRMENLQTVPPIWLLLERHVATMPKGTIRDGLKVCLTTAKHSGASRNNFLHVLSKSPLKYEGYAEQISDKAVSLIERQAEVIRSHKF